MLHSKHITLPANRTEATATYTRFMVNQGVIYRVWVTFPAGCAGLVKVRISFGGHPFLPVESNAYISGDNYVFEYPVMFEIKEPPEQIKIQAWNEDDIYCHTIDVQFSIIDKAWVQPIGAYEGVIAALKSLFVNGGSK